MSYLINNQQKVNDIIFANRNKNYGAYVLRSSYGNTLLKSLMIMITGLCSLMGIVYYLSNRQDVSDAGGQIVPDIFKNTLIDITPKVNKLKKTICPPARNNPEGKKSEKGVTTVVDSSDVEKPAKVNSEVPVTAIAQGTAPAGMPDTGEGNGDPNVINRGKGEGDVSPEVADPFGVDSQPEFEGGLGALYKFVARNMHYPALASDIGKEGTVYVKFVVDEKGKVGNLKLLNTAGYGFDDEALRVIGLIPNFKTPAKMGGRPVKVYYQLPIKFRLR